MSEFAVDLNQDDHAAAADLLKRAAPWNQPPGRNYWTAEAPLDDPWLKGAARAFFIKMTPGSSVYRHRDPREVVDYFDTDHVVVTTNPRCFICWQEQSGAEKSQHLELGRRYRVVDRGLLHWAYNDGDTDRVHLLIEYPKSV